MSDDSPTFPLEDQSPKTIKDRYQIESELGRGGMGVVYFARDLQLHNRPVVIKVLRDVMHGEWQTKKFRQEIEALVRMEHPGIVGVFDAGEMPDGRLFVVMQFVEGVNLRSIIKRQTRPMDLEKVAQIMDQVGRALTAAHDKGVIHCDLKPENIMLQQLQPGEEIVKLIDFGIAKIRDSQISSSEPTKIAGTMEYMAPEQLAGNPIAASDIFTMGIICYELVTGQKPYPANNLVQLFELHRNGVKQKPRELRPELPEAAQTVILKALSFDPKDRHSKAREFSEDFAKALRVDTVEATKEIAPGPPKGFIRSAVKTFLAFAVLALLVWWMTRSASKPAVVAPAAPPVRVEQPKVILSDLFLHYSILVQRFRDGKPYREPFRLAKEINFEPEDRIQLHVRSPQSGHLYILNEGPLKENGMPQYNVLFPTSLNNSGSAVVQWEQDIQIPGKGWFLFDKEEGTEKIWMIFSAKAVPELEDVKGLANPKDLGEIREPSQITAVRGFLEKQSKPETERDIENVQTVVKGKGDALVHLVLLEHH